jgi:hypothetical protein
MAHFALMWNVKPGTEEAVKELFRNYGRPEPVVRGEDGSVQGQLLGTQVFIKGNTVVRVMEVEGDFVAVARHLARQPAVQDLESKLDEYLEVPRDHSSPEAMAKFFQQSSMELLLARTKDD